MRVNLHNHSAYSDGALTAEAIVRVAMDFGLTHVAVTDHFASTKVSSRSVDPRLLPAYAGEIRELAAKVSGRIKVLAGIEVDFSPRRTNFEVFAADREESVFRHLDFVLFEYVGDPQWDGASLEDLIGIRGRIPCPVGLAHCQFDRTFAGFMPQTVVTLLENHKLFLELCPSERNASLVLPNPSADSAKTQRELEALHRQEDVLRKQLAERPDDPYLLELRKQIEQQMAVVYQRFRRVPAYRLNNRFTRELFTRLRGRNAALSIGTDTHDDPQEIGAIDDAVKFIEENMLQKNVITNFFWKT